MSRYREFQFSWLIIGIFLPMQALTTYLYINRIGNNPLPLTGYVYLTVLFFIIVLLFYGMTTLIDNDKIVISFGIGLIRKRVVIRDIKYAQPVQTPWYYGYGIRWIPNGWLFNVSGSDAVQINFKHHKRIITIGTRKQAVLTNEIRKRIAGYS